MTPNWQIAWQDGLLLTAQHLEQQQQLINTPLVNTLKLLNPYYWGLSKLEIQNEALEQGIVKIVKAEGIFKNGQYFSYQSCIDNPLSLDLSLSTDITNVYLYYDNNAITMNKNNIEINKAQLNLTTQINASMQHLQILKVSRTQQSAVLQIIEDYICASLNSDLAISHIQSLSREAAMYPALKHITTVLSTLETNSNLHPYALYQRLIQLCLACQFNGSIEPYNHDNILPLIKTLTHDLKCHIQNKYRFCCYHFSRYEFYWALQQSILKSQIKDFIIAIPKHDGKNAVTEELIKVTDSSQIETISRFAIQGLPISQLHILPETIINEPQYLYYRIDIASQGFSIMPEELLPCLHIMQQNLMDTPKCWIKY